MLIKPLVSVSLCMKDVTALCKTLEYVLHEFTHRFFCPTGRFLPSSVMQRTLRCLQLNSSEVKSESFAPQRGKLIHTCLFFSSPFTCLPIRTSCNFWTVDCIYAQCFCACRDSLLASLLDGVRASGNRDVCVKMAPTQRGQRWGLLSMPVDEEVESLHLKFLAAPPSEC